MFVSAKLILTILSSPLSHYYTLRLLLLFKADVRDFWCSRRHYSISLFCSYFSFFTSLIAIYYPSSFRRSKRTKISSPLSQLINWQGSNNCWYNIFVFIFTFKVTSYQGVFSSGMGFQRNRNKMEPFFRVKAARRLYAHSSGSSLLEKVCLFFFQYWTKRGVHILRYSIRTRFNYSDTKSSVNETFLFGVLYRLYVSSQRNRRWYFESRRTTYMFVFNIDSSFTPTLIPVSGIKK